RARPCSSFTSVASQHLCAVHTYPPLRRTTLTLSLLILPSVAPFDERSRRRRSHGHGNHTLLGRGCLSWAVHGDLGSLLRRVEDDNLWVASYVLVY
ncbi:uncharacterized protein SCHCODRAFT_02746832, partial [Schizophyllum commune H4-8]|uniref:uncharacterized protein n=1 Tax=Schizophyllum commune (strain H4-8 / FGSC 9210) TaxID=578458 RepID=UPI00215E8A05